MKRIVFLFSFLFLCSLTYGQNVTLTETTGAIPAQPRVNTNGVLLSSGVSTYTISQQNKVTERLIQRALIEDFCINNPADASCQPDLATVLANIDAAINTLTGGSGGSNGNALSPELTNQLEEFKAMSTDELQIMLNKTRSK